MGELHQNEDLEMIQRDHLDRFESFKIVFWCNFDQIFIKTDENHWKINFHKILMKFDIRNMFFESHYHMIWSTRKIMIFIENIEIIK